MGNVFQIYVPTGAAAGAAPTTVSGKVLYAPASKAVVVRVSPDFSTAYVTTSMESFAAGVPAMRGRIALRNGGHFLRRAPGGSDPGRHDI